ncbi:MAG TPA: DNA-binding protein Alba [Thermoplasmatales archaeon]|nr:DNA-binding protein Alba [Candidatus Thermoplasmatota archaeon]MDD5778837.1 DNA-binding protein Alba [Candidatus Thermoplasmatota archaeon]HDS59824.1 DNA-binding protein Alba [Thermoplasmatales archaeon]
MDEENIVYVGNKAPMSYVIAVITEFEQGAKSVTLKARGRAISRAVDAAEIVRNKFLPDVTVAGISIDTEEIESEEGGKRNVSSMEISLSK